MRVRPWRLGLLAILVVIVCFCVWAGWRTYQVQHHMSLAVDNARSLQQAVVNDDRSSERSALAGMQAHSAAADDLTSGPTWTVLAHLPWVGDDARGVRVASSSAADLAAHGVGPLLSTTDKLDSLLPRDAQVSTSALTRLQGPVAEGEASFARAQAALDAEDPSGFFGPLRDTYRSFTDQVSQAHAVLSAANTAMQVMPSMLGEDGPRHYLLVFQNNAEVRSTGGLPGAVSLVTATHGKVEMTKQVAAASFGERPEPVLPLTEAEQRIYGQQLGTYFLDANFTPDFPRTADLMRARWEEVYGGHIDGVLSIDPVAMSYILGAVGPVDVDGMHLTSDNAVDVLLHQVYVDHPSPTEQDAVFRKVGRAVFDKVSHGADSPISLARALARASSEHRIYVHSFHANEQSELAPTTVAGELTSGDPHSPQVGVYLNDTTGSKMSYYLRYRADVDSTYCTGGVQGLSGSAHFDSRAPADAASLPNYITGGGVHGTSRGDQLVSVRLVGPVDGSIDGVQLNSRPVHGLEVVVDDHRPVVTVVVELGPGEMADLAWQMKTGALQDGPVRVSVTPGIEPKDTSSTVVSSCSS